MRGVNVPFLFCFLLLSFTIFILLDKTNKPADLQDQVATRFLSKENPTSWHSKSVQPVQRFEIFKTGRQPIKNKYSCYCKKKNL